MNDSTKEAGMPKGKPELIRIDEGEIELLSGRERLKQAEDMRVAFALGASFFACLAVLLGFRWRRPLSRLFKHSDS